MSGQVIGVSEVVPGREPCLPGGYTSSHRSHGHLVVSVECRNPDGVNRAPA